MPQFKLPFIAEPLEYLFLFILNFAGFYHPRRDRINAGQAVLFAFIVAGLLEETTKYLVVRAVENHAKLSYEQSVINQK